MKIMKIVIKNGKNVKKQQCILNGPKAFIEYSNAMDDVYKNIMIIIQILFDEWIAVIMTNETFQAMI